jgi:PAS domain-containing protein
VPLDDPEDVRRDVISPGSVDTTGVLATIYDAICQMIGPIQELPRAIPLLERIAQAVEDRRDSTEQIGLLYQDREVLFQADSDQLLKLAPAPVAVVGRDHRFISVSDSYCRLFRFSRRQLRTLLAKDLWDEKDGERFMLASRRLFADKAKSGVFVGRRLTGKGDSILTRLTAWSVRRNPSAMPEIGMGIHQRLADRHEAPALFARCAEKLAANRHRLLSPRARSIAQARPPRSAVKREPRR